MPYAPDPVRLFRLKPIRVARVSEVSEATAAASVPPEERINFHIGNPLQDARLSSAFLRTALGLDIGRDDLCDADPAALLGYLGWGAADRPKLDFLIRTIQKSAPYMPRGGYSSKAPHALYQAFRAWLEDQQEALRYDSGEQSGRREIILASGGVHETLRVILFTLSSYLETLPARILCYGLDLPPSLGAMPGLLVERLDANEQRACEQVDRCLSEQPQTPTFLILGSVPGEVTRRRLRALSLDRPLFFIEANDAPNHLSLAREAKLVQRVIRLLSPAIFAPRLGRLSTMLIAGNADYLSAIENVHFSLKGTPSASEIELLSFLLEQPGASAPQHISSIMPQAAPGFEGLALGGATETALSHLAEQASHHLDALLDAHARLLDRSLTMLDEKATAFSGRVHAAWKGRLFDEFAAVEVRDLLDLLIENIDRPEMTQALERSFLSAFARHQPQYEPDACLVTSGSSRTALSILGFHCGIAEVVIPDLSWSYEQCFPFVHAVPLSESFELDADAMIGAIDELCQRDPAWRERGAVALNNPHNATGRVFSEEAVRKLLVHCLERGIYVIDDLAYQNVAPVNALPEIKTVRQMVSELVRLGVVDERRADRVITVHSMSKTDCLAGARLAVVEIRDRALRQRFEAVNAQIQPNLAALLICYLFYRGPSQAVRTYWHLRNAIYADRTSALLTAAANLPPERNPFRLTIIPPTGSMYPLLHVELLPPGLSLDWLASSLARRGIGLLPLATFARTEKGFETGRTTFRLTLGGADPAETLLVKTRRLLIDLNRLIAEEDARYNRRELTFHAQPSGGSRSAELARSMEAVAERILEYCADSRSARRLMALPLLDEAQVRRDFLRRYGPERLDVFRTRLLDRALISDDLARQALGDGGSRLAERLQQEFMKDSLLRRQELFRLRSYDRTVHPTQMYSLQAEMALDTILAALIAGQPVEPPLIERAAQALLQEYLGLNVSITSEQEADEILLDLAALGAGEQHAALFTDTSLAPFLSFWSDWDGSNRPSGQGHRLAAAVVMENVRRMAHILTLLRQVDPDIPISRDLLSELNRLDQRNRRFTGLLNEITLLTQQLEGRYRGILPFSLNATPLQRLATRWHMRRDPAQVLWQHNDRYEQKMLELRQERRRMLEYYFGLNKQLRKQLHALIPAIQQHLGSERLLREVTGYQDILQRVVITPRIQQSLITARDQFAIDTTVYNMHEINTVAGEFGNPGMTLAVQISLSTRPDALISLDRKMRTQLEQARREHPASDLPAIWLIPLFENIESVRNVRGYLDQVWDYATQSRHTVQSPQSRFSEIIAEVFVAGSDLSQQVSQAAAAYLYQKAKYDLQSWLVEHGAAQAVRVKLGSGEPMQRQGGYYSRVAGVHAFQNSAANKQRYAEHLLAAARKSTAYAVTPLQGVFLGGDLRTFQSNLSEQLRTLPARELVSLLYHVREAQRQHRDDLIRAAETAVESRLTAQNRGLQELERLTIGTNDALYEQFLEELTDSFRHILYGREEDVVGIHIISYFIGRSIPQLRDRPTSRRTLGTGPERGQRILANIAEIIPLAKQGSLLRAISHNQAQTAVLGANQVTTGLFRALERFAQKAFVEAERERMIAERLLPHLPVYEILHSLRLYQDRSGEFLRSVETAFPAGNSAFVALREDNDAMQRYLPLFQQELLRCHGVTVSEFFADGVFIPDLLPALRPDLAVLLQQNLFNTDPDAMLEHVSGRIADGWRAEVTRLLRVPEQIHGWRSVIWEVIGDSIYQRVQSFAELATALYSFAATRSFSTTPPGTRGAKLSPVLAGFFRTARADDEMRDFLIGAVEYLRSFTEGNLEMPVSIIRAMHGVERIALIEESALPPEKLHLFRHCVLEIARLAGENG
ncbi:MAG: pyridoxal phosphate-dependent aminotransferase [Anaerolineae bacterium]|nr:pyridoxal phosphate-dependent aminotransferase [Anaerolineae bacterium]